MSYYLFLDDLRKPSDVKWVDLPAQNWVIVRSYDEFVKTIEARGLPSFITFDCDLADEHYRKTMFTDPQKYASYYLDANKWKERTGYDAAKWLVQYCLENHLALPEYRVHSMNPVGREAILALFKSARERLNL